MTRSPRPCGSRTEPSARASTGPAASSAPHSPRRSPPMDDDLRQVRTLLDKPPPADAVVHAGRDRLAAAARRRSRRPVWMAAGLTLTAATAATAVAVATLGGPAGDVRRPDVTAS